MTTTTTTTPKMLETEATPKMLETEAEARAEAKARAVPYTDTEAIQKGRTRGY